MLDASALPGPVAFVFGGGGSYGAMQVGMLHSLYEHGIHPDLVVGTSVGALNGAVVASAPENAPARLSRIWASLRRREVLGGGFLRRLVRERRSATYVYSSDGIGDLLGVTIGDGNIEDMPIPFGAIAMDIDEQRGVVLSDGPTVTAVLASAAIPGVFPPIERNGRRYYDGGLASLVPVLEALRMGAKSIVALDCVFADRYTVAPDNLVNAMFWATLVAARSQVARDLPIAASEVPVLYPPGPAPRILSPLDFRHSALLIESSYRAANDFFDSVSVEGPGLYRSGDRAIG